MALRPTLGGALWQLSYVRFTAVIAIATAVLAWFFSLKTQWQQARLALTLLAALGMSLPSLLAPAPIIDVRRVHLEAANLMQQGQNPYEDFDVSADPSGTGRHIVGYPYSPINLIAYGVPSILVDPRWVSAVCFVGIAYLLGSRTSGLLGPWWLVLVAVTSPMVTPLLVGTFTEVFVAALLLMAHEAYIRWPGRITAFGVGIALGSKQHLLVGLPGLGRANGFRITICLLAGSIVSLGSGFLISPSAYLDATVSNPAQLEPNFLSASLYGMSGGRFLVPLVVAVGTATLIGIVVGQRTTKFTLEPLAWSLAALLALHPNTIWSHWVVVGWLLTRDRLQDDAYRTNSLRNLPV